MNANQTIANLHRTIDTLAEKLAENDRYAELGKWMMDCVTALGDAKTGPNVPRDEAVNSYIAAHAALTEKLAAVERERDEYRLWCNRVRAEVRCPECKCQSITLTDDTMWNCDNCKRRWSLNSSPSLLLALAEAKEDAVANQDFNLAMSIQTIIVSLKAQEPQA